MSIDSDIQAALLGNLRTPPLSGSPPIAYPFVEFVPTPDVAFLDARPVLRAGTEHFGVAYGNSDIFSGIFQVDAVIPNGKGEAPGLRLAALVADRFAIGTQLAAGGRRLEIVGTPTIAPAVTDAPWVRFPVSIPYRVIT
jgi:hypothetical protein